MTTGNITYSVKLSPEIVAAQGKNDQEYLALRVKLLLDVMDKHPRVSINDITKLAGTAACGCGCCCCGGSCCMVPDLSTVKTLENVE
jgi:hypothetical protein